MKYYFGMLEIDTGSHTEEEYRRLAAAMNELKIAAGFVGQCTYYEVALESQYRKAEQELKQQVRRC